MILWLLTHQMSFGKGFMLRFGLLQYVVCSPSLQNEKAKLLYQVICQAVVDSNINAC